MRYGKVVENNQVNINELNKYGLSVCKSMSNPETQSNGKKVPHINKDDNVSPNIQELLDCNKKRCGLPSYDKRCFMI